MKVSFLLSCLFLSLPAHAEWSLQPSGRDAIRAESLPPGITLKPLLRVTTDRDRSVYALELMLGQGGAASGLYLVGSGQGPRDGKAFLLSDVAKPAGITLLEAEGRKVLLLQGAFNQKKGDGLFHLSYLKNGLWMTYESCNVRLRSSGKDFYMQNAYTGARVSAVKVITSSLGVDTLEGICPIARR